VGEGLYWSYDYPAASFGVAPSAGPEAVTIIVSLGGDDWSIHLAAPSGQVLDVGSFENAERVPSSLTPGLDVRANGRRCNETFGDFTVSQVLVEAGGRFQSLEATFIQHCEFPDGPALRGTVIYRAPDPSAATTGS
jgi:hypothetical protein